MAEKAAENDKKTEEMRQRHLEERRQLLEQTEEFGMSEMEDELQKLEDQLDANQEDELFCVACNKELRNEKAFAAHRYYTIIHSFMLVGKCTVCRNNK